MALRADLTIGWPFSVDEVFRGGNSPLCVDVEQNVAEGEAAVEVSPRRDLLVMLARYVAHRSERVFERCAAAFDERRPTAITMRDAVSRRTRRCSAPAGVCTRSERVRRRWCRCFESADRRSTFKNGPPNTRSTVALVGLIARKHFYFAGIRKQNNFIACLIQSTSVTTANCCHRNQRLKADLGVLTCRARFDAFEVLRRLVVVDANLVVLRQDFGDRWDESPVVALLVHAAVTHKCDDGHSAPPWLSPRRGKVHDDVVLEGG